MADKKPKPTYKQWVAKQQRVGYEEAMLDIVRAIQAAGDTDAALIWIKDNTKPGDEAHEIVQELVR